MHGDISDDQLVEAHDRQVKVVAEAVFGLVDRFAPAGITPITVFEGALKGAVLVMLARQGDAPDDIADLLEDAAEAVRRMRPDEWATKN